MTEIPMYFGKQNPAYRFTAFNLYIMKLIFRLAVLLLVLSCISNSSSQMKQSSSENGFFAANHPFIQYFGRINNVDSSQAVFAFPGVNIRFAFKGTRVSVYMRDLTDAGIQADGNPAQNFFNVYIDDKEPYVLVMTQVDSIYKLAEGLPDKIHRVKLVKRTESLAGKISFQGIILEKSALIYQLPVPDLKIEFIGNSITCGYGVEAESKNEPYSCRTENVSLSYAVLAAEKLNAEYSIVPLKKSFVPRLTTTISGINRE